MKKGEIIEGLVESVSFPNKGNVITDEGRVIVKNVIPGQTVRFMITKKRKTHFEGRLIDVIEKSEFETQEKMCSIFPECGGCTYQTMGYENQINMKKEQVKNLLLPVIQEYQKPSDNEVSEMFTGISPSPEIRRYRNKMEYSFGDACKDGPLTLGFHKKGSNFDILTASDCALVHPDINEIVKCVLNYCTQKGFSYYHRMSHQGFLRHLLIRRSSLSGEIIAAIVTSSQTEHDFESLKDELCNLELEGTLAGFLRIINDGVADVVKSDRTDILFGRDYFYEEILGLKFKITPFSFFQTNTKGAEVLYSVVRDYIGNIDNAVLFDLYSGTGTIAQVLAPAAGKVIGVEIVEEAVESAKENAKLNGLDNCSFIAGDVLKVLDEISDKPDFLILDPPREGINPKALQKLIQYNAERIVYISCKPTSLARDLETLLQNGYKVEKIRCVDMFPMAAHVETVVLLQKKNL